MMCEPKARSGAAVSGVLPVHSECPDLDYARTDCLFATGVIDALREMQTGLLRCAQPG
jgi:hypothetical protein